MTQIKNNKSICSNCGKKINNDTTTIFDKNNNPYCSKRCMGPTKNEIIDYMERHNDDEIGIGDQWDFETAEYFLLFEDEFHIPPEPYKKKIDTHKKM